ncbi:MAG TPA: hypothetical protein PLM75_00975, partial [bacterium]|nr:hypothetical protein [bacterium]
MKFRFNIFSLASQSLAIKFTLFILALLLIIISLLIWLNLRSTLDIMNNQNTTFIDNSQNLIQKNFDYAITQITELLNKQFKETTEMMTASLTQATMQKGKAVISNLSGQIGNAIANYDFGFAVTAFNEIFKNDETVVYAALIDSSKNAMFYKISGNFLTKKKNIKDENFYDNSEYEGKTI